MSWTRRFVSSFEARGAFNAMMSRSKLGILIMAFVPLTMLFAAVKQGRLDNENRHEAEAAFMIQCEKTLSHAECTQRVEANSKKCFRVSDTAPNAMNIDMKQYYPCTLKSYAVWGPEYRAAKKKHKTQADPFAPQR